MANSMVSDLIALNEHSVTYILLFRLNTVYMFIFSGESPDDHVKGFYKVRAVDYWNQTGSYSLPQQYPSPIY